MRSVATSSARAPPRRSACTAMRKRLAAGVGHDDRRTLGFLRARRVGDERPRARARREREPQRRITERPPGGTRTATRPRSGGGGSGLAFWMARTTLSSYQGLPERRSRFGSESTLPGASSSTSTCVSSGSRRRPAGSTQACAHVDCARAHPGRDLGRTAALPDARAAGVVAAPPAPGFSALAVRVGRSTRSGGSRRARRAARRARRRSDSCGLGGGGFGGGGFGGFGLRDLLAAAASVRPGFGSGFGSGSAFAFGFSGSRCGVFGITVSFLAAEAAAASALRLRRQGLGRFGDRRRGGTGFAAAGSAAGGSGFGRTGLGNGAGLPAAAGAAIATRSTVDDARAAPRSAAPASRATPRATSPWPNRRRRRSSAAARAVGSRRRRRLP